jgi:hypothetical protein
MKEHWSKTNGMNEANEKSVLIYTEIVQFFSLSLPPGGETLVES